MGSSKRGMLNVLIAAVLWGSSGVCAQYIMQQSQMSSPYLTMIRLLFAGLILLMLAFVHGDKIFRVMQNRKDALSLLFFSLVGALTCAVHLPDDYREVERRHRHGATVFVADDYRRLVRAGA